MADEGGDGLLDGGTLGGSAGGEDEGDGGNRLDVGGGTGATAGDGTVGCGKVDFLFVIDNSESMALYQGNVRANFGGFIDSIENRLGDVGDFHVGVVTTDAFHKNIAGCRFHGGLVAASEAGECGPYADGFNYMTQNDDLDEAFQCAGTVGRNGAGEELSMKAMEAVLNREQAGPGECNEGFLRDDALLVVVLLTDQAEGPGDPAPHSEGDPQSWFETVVRAKGKETNAVVVSFLTYWGGPCEPSRYGSFFEKFFDGQNLVDFTSKFTYGIYEGICVQDYAAVFDRAIEPIADACDGFVPVG